MLWKVLATFSSFERHVSERCNSTLQIVPRFQARLCFPSCLLRILDNLNDFQFVLDYRAILQSNNDTHRLGDSSTGMYSYTVYLFAVPVILTLVPGTNLFLPFCSCSGCPPFSLCLRYVCCTEIAFLRTWMWTVRLHCNVLSGSGQTSGLIGCSMLTLVITKAKGRLS